MPMLHDNEGENISTENDKFCELTGQYWVWKHIDADYYGFMHYRRHFVFKDIKDKPRTDGTIFFPKLTKAYMDYVGLDDGVIEECISGYDLILPERVDVNNWDALTNEIQFASLSNLHAKDFAIVCEVIKELYPEYVDKVEEFRNEHYAYWFNMFIMKRWLFNKYNEWLFPILEIAKERVDYSLMDAQEKRTLAFMAERLFTIFVMKLLEDNKGIRVKHLKMTFLDSVEMETRDGKEGKQVKEGWEKAYDELHAMGNVEVMVPDFERCNAILNEVKIRDLIFYGAGEGCRNILNKLDGAMIKFPKSIWDVNAEQKPQLYGVRVCYPDFQKMDNNIVYVITIMNKNTSTEIKRKMLANGASNVYSYDEINRALLVEMWQRKNKRR